MLDKWSLYGVLSLGKCKSYVSVCLLNILLKLQLFVPESQPLCTTGNTFGPPRLLPHRQLISVVRRVVQPTGHCDCLSDLDS